MDKFYKENCLAEQDFVKNPDLTVAQYADECAKEMAEKSPSPVSCASLWASSRNWMDLFPKGRKPARVRGLFSIIGTLVNSCMTRGARASRQKD